MKKFILLSILSIIVILCIALIFTSPSTPNKKSPILVSISPAQTTPKTRELSTITVNNTVYTYDTIGPIRASQLSLVSNLPRKLSSQELKELHQCKSLTSAGFYDTSDTHIGLFVVNNETISQQAPNSLFRSIVFVAQNGSAGISDTIPNLQLHLALQTGPVLIQDGQEAKLALRVDEQARRIAIGLTDENTFILYGIFGDHVFTGPELANLPAIISAINTKENITVQTVVNLDGGNHAAYMHNGTVVSEVSPVGGIFCIQ